MKKFLVILAACAAVAACANSNNKAGASSSSAAGPLITDREFEHLEAPKMDYEKDISYEAQLKSSGTFIRGIKGSRPSGSKTESK